MSYEDIFKPEDSLGLAGGDNPANIYLFKVIIFYEICSKLTVQTPEWRRSGVFIVNFEYVSHLFLVFLMLALVTSKFYLGTQHFFTVVVWRFNFRKKVMSALENEKLLCLYKSRNVFDKFTIKTLKRIEKLLILC